MPHISSIFLLARKLLGGFLPILVNIPPWDKRKPKLVFGFGFFPSFVGGVEGRGCAVGVFFLVEGCVGGFSGVCFFLFRNMLRM